MNNSPFQRAGKRLLTEHRIFLLLAAVWAVMALVAPRFMTLANFTTILKGTSLALPATIGFTIVMIAGKLDLSVGSSITLGGMMAIGLQPHLGWGGSVAAALLCGLAVGLLNGFLVAKVRVDSFIVTLGTMILSQGFIYIFCQGGTLAARSYRFGAWMETPHLPLLPPRVLIGFLLVALFEWLMRRTRVGRNVYLVGGNPATAWASAVPVDRIMIGVFALSGVLSCLGGALFSVGISAALPTMGANSLMEVVAAVIIGGTAMSGGKGSVMNSMVALLTLTMLYNGLECMGAGWEVRKIAGGVVLGAVVLYDAVLAARHRRVRGRRHELMAELNQDAFWKEAESAETRGEQTMERKDSTALAIVVVGAVACVAIVAIFAMVCMNRRQTEPRGEPPAAEAGSIRTESASVGGAALAAESAAKEREVAGLRSKDNQPLILPAVAKTIPPRPADPEALPETDPLHWYDMEYAGWGVKKVNLPESPANGPNGKRVVFLKASDHPYWKAVQTGMEKVAQVYGIALSQKVANGDINIQSQQVDQCLNECPDMVIIGPVEAKACVPLLRKLNEAGIPVIAINLLPASEAHQYLLSWTGPDDWGQFRLLAREFAKRMNGEGGYCIVRHFPGWSPFFARTWSVITELGKVAPKMKLLAMQPTELESEKTKDVVSGWLTRFGPELKGIVSCDDSGAQVGINEAANNAGREDLIRAAAGNSKVGMDFVKDGKLHAITYQSPEADGAIPMKLAADWFYGQPIPPIQYLPIAIIDRENVEQYMPAQW